VRVNVDTEYAVYQYIAAMSQFRQVTPRRLLPTPLLQLENGSNTRSFPVFGIWSNSDCSPNTHLEFDLLLPVVSGLVEAETDGDVMEVLLHCSSVCYAVIEASSKTDRPERLVIAYHDENCLRDLIAASSIIGLGFASREEAIANLEGHMSDSAPSKQKPGIIAPKGRLLLTSSQMLNAADENEDLPSGQGLVHRRIPYRILQSALAAAIARFYAKNMVSLMIRMVLGASL
jgi:hypothetical protein